MPSRVVAPESPPNILERPVPPAPIREGLMVEQDAAVARLAEGPEGEGAVISQGAEDEGHEASGESSGSGFRSRAPASDLGLRLQISEQPVQPLLIRVG